jgi:hypothetical protein
MSTLSPLHADAFALLRQNLYYHLDEADFLALKYDDWSEEDIGHARALIPDLVRVIRGLVVLHEPPDVSHGPNCHACGTPWPCEALETIHRLVKDPEAEFVKLVRIADART